MANRKRYCQIGLGSRSGMYTRAIWNRYADIAELVGLCDTNPGRMDLVNQRRPEGHPEIPTYSAEQFDQMIAQCRPDAVIVTTVDGTHHQYIIRAMELGCDAITEKPMTTDADKCRAILEAQARTGRKLRVTFNYRYSPPRSQVKQMILDGVIGDVLAVDFTWLLNTRHGADYFRRWHRHRDNSGSLLVHKATHHFDLVNWWLDSVPQRVSAFGARQFYTPATADRLGLAGRSERCHGCPVAEKCDFRLDLAGNENLKALYLDNEAHDGYFRDRCVFSDAIDIWDNMVVNVAYRNGAQLSYCLQAFQPWEGYRISFSGTLGRIEHNCCESTYISGDGTVPGELEKGKTTTTLIPMFEKPRALEIWTGTGGHGGGDDPLLDSVFLLDPPADPLNRAASQVDGTYSILAGIAAYTSIDQAGQPVAVAELLGDWAGRM